MINNPKGFSTENHPVDLQLQNHFPTEPSHEIDQNLMFFQPSMEMFTGLNDELQQANMMPHFQQDLKKSMQSHQADLQSIFGEFVYFLLND